MPRGPAPKIEKDDLDRWDALRLKALRKFDSHLEEARQNIRLYENDEAAWRELAPGGMGPSSESAHKSQTVINNIIASIVDAEIEQSVPKHPRAQATSLRPKIQTANIDPETGEAIEDDNGENASAFGEVATMVSRKSGLRDVLRRAMYDSRLTNEGYIVVSGSGGADYTTTTMWPIAPEGEDETRGEKEFPYGPLATLNSSPGIPYVGYESFDNIICDPYADDDRQMNFMWRRIRRPLKDVQKEMVEDIDEATGQPKLDEAGQPVMKHKYSNWKKLRSNVVEEEGGADEDEIRDFESPGDADDGMLEYWELHYRRPILDRETRRKYKSAFKYFILTYASCEIDDYDRESGVEDDGLIEMRHEEYQVDLGRFAIHRLQFKPLNRRQKGHSFVRNVKRAVALHNHTMSLWFHWSMRNVTRRFYDPELVDPGDLDDAETGDPMDWIPMRSPGPGRAMQDGLALSPTANIPQEIPALAQHFDQLANQLAGLGPNQRGAFQGIRTAAEVKEISTRSNAVLGEVQEKVKEYAESILMSMMAIFVAELDEDGKFYLARPDGSYLQYDKRKLFCDAILEIDYTSMMRDEPMAKIKQWLDFFTVLQKTPPQMLELYHPILKRIAAAFGPDAEVAYQELRKAMMKKQPSDPDVEHLMILDGQVPNPAPDEDFTTTIPKHEQQLLMVQKEPKAHPLWHVKFIPTQQGKELTAAEALSMHIAASYKVGEQAGTLAPSQRAGQTIKNDQGSGPGSGRLDSGDGTGSEEELVGAAERVD